MSINVKKYTKDQMAKMVEDAAERQEAAEAEALSDRYYLNQAEGREALARRFAAAVTRPTVMGSLREGWFLCLR